MIQSYITTTLRNLWRNKLYTVINMLGLSIGLASCLLIIMFVDHETGYDRFLPDLERLYRLEAVANIPGREAIDVSTYVGPTKDLLPKDYPEVEEVLRIQVRSGSIVKDSEVFAESLAYVDANFYHVFKLPLVEGNAATAFAEPSNIVLSETMARKYLGDGPYLGRTLTINDNFERVHKVSGIMRDLPDNSHLDLDILLPIEPRVFAASNPGGASDLERWNGLPFYVYVKLRPGASIEPMKATINDWVDRYFPAIISTLVNIKGSELFTPRFIAVADIHLFSPAQGGFKPRGSIGRMITFASIALLILLIASINFMNLATARGTLRSREVAVRKVMGASRRQLFFQFEGESLFLSFVSLLLGVSLVEMILPYFNGFTQITLSMSLLAEPVVLAGSILLGLVVGLLAGLHPALVLSGLRPSRVLAAGGLSFPATSRLRTGLVIFQFAVSAILIIGAAIIYVQNNYVRSMDFGYLRDNQMVVRGLGNPQIGAARETFRERVRRLPGVSGVSLASFAPGDRSGAGLSLKLPGMEDRLVIFYRSVDWDFFDVFGVSPIAGRVFDRAHRNDVARVSGEAADAPQHSGAVINQLAVRRMGFASPDDALGKRFYRGGNDIMEVEVVGVIPDILFSSPRQTINPEIYLFEPAIFSALNIHYQTDDPEALGQRIDAVWKEMFPGLPVNRTFLDENIARQFQAEEIQGRLVAIFSGLAIFVACIGLFALSSFAVIRRTREIGLRKVMGASSARIMRLLLGQLSLPVMVANILAWPVGWYAMSEWLNTFNYRISLPGYFLTISGGTVLVTLVIAWATVAWHAWRVARSNPITALRYE